MKAPDHVKILHLISGLDLGGAERMLLWSARYHDRRSFRLMVLSLMSGGQLAESIRREGIRVLELGQRRGRFSMAGFLALVKAAREYSPDLIQGHLFHSNILSRLLAPFVPGSMAISTRHNERDSFVRRFIYAMTSPLNKATIVFSPSVRRHARADDLARRPIHLAPYGIDPAQPSLERSRLRNDLGISGDFFLWIAVGRLARQKGFHLLIEAFRLLQTRTDLMPVLVIVGEGKERADLEKRAAAAGLGDQIRFAGARLDVPDLLAASDAFVLSSLWEGGPLVILEAMAAGLPVVATDVGDVASMVDQGRSGIIVKPGDTEALARAMSKIMDLGAEGSVWGDAGRRRLTEEFSFSATQSSVESLYRDLAGFNRGD